MNETMEKLNKLSLPAVILIASIILGGFYYASQESKQKSIERQQQIEIEQKKQEQLTKELKEQEVKEKTEQSLNTCLADADTSYSNQWFRECKAQGKLTKRCISLHDMTFKEYQEEKGLKDFEGFDDYFKEKDDCSCLLPTATAKSVEDYKDKLKDECFKKYPQN